MRACLHQVALGAAIPYGYTVLTAGSGGMLIGRHGPPTLAAGLLFVLGAALAFMVLSAAAQPDGERDPSPPRGVISGVAAALGVLAASAVVAAVPGIGAFGLVAFVTTLVYLGVEAVALWVVQRRA